MKSSTPIGSILRELRGNRSLREIEKISGVSYGHIRNIENGFDPRTRKEINPSIDVLKKLSHAYNYPFNNLMTMAGYVELSGEISVHSNAAASLTILNATNEQVADIYNHTLTMLSEGRANVNGHVLPPHESDRFSRAFKVFIEAFFSDYFDDKKSE